MATTASLLSLLPYLLLAALASASVEDVCTKAATRDKNVDYGFCVRTLQTAPGGPNADDRGLAVIAGNLGSQKAQATLPVIADLQKAASQEQKGPLNQCQELYGNAVDALKTAAKTANDNRYPEANQYFSKAIDAARTCEEGFSDKKIKSPLAEDDNELYQFGAIGATITHTGP